ncbi:insulinase family protein [uncultured Roseobacter sp.]|uniref:M16 family metallopeptidase n=1 Tax=uncultured Roseobacter sp. TaxID=114847 RepID=UPI0026273D05|nr:insulinase family protein [uncultured Roseobacter sp.]
MKHFAVAVIASLVLSGCSDDAPSSNTETSPGGIDYVRLYIPEAEVVAIQIAWPTDWPLREDANQAVPYIGADLILAGGADGFPASEVVEMFADLQVTGRLSVTSDNVLGSLVAPKENLGKAFEIANAHLRAPLLERGWFEGIQQSFAANMAEASAAPAHQGFAAVRWAVLGDIPLRRALSVDPPEQITSATPEDVASWHRETIVRNDAKIVIAGAIDAEEAGAAIDDLFAGLPAAGARVAKTPSTDFTPRRILLHVPEANTSTLSFVAPMPPMRDGGELEDIILVSALGEGKDSVLFEAVRTQLRATYGLSAHLDAYTRDIRLLYFGGEVETSKLAQAATIVQEAYASFREVGPPQGFLESLEGPFVAQSKKTAADPVAASTSALMALLDDQDPSVALDLASALDRVTSETLRQRLANAFPAAQDFIIVAVSPDADALPNACVISKPRDVTDCQ